MSLSGLLPLTIPAGPAPVAPLLKPFVDRHELAGRDWSRRRQERRFIRKHGWVCRYRRPKGDVEGCDVLDRLAVQTNDYNRGHDASGRRENCSG